MYNTTYNSNILNVNAFIGMPLVWGCNKPVQVRVNKPRKVSWKKVVDVVYRYIDAYTGKEIGLSKVQLLRLGQDFITFARESQCLFVKIFWEKRGITHEAVKYWCQRDPEFKMLFEFGLESIKHSRGTLALDDIIFIRSIAPLYIQEFKAYDIEMLEIKSRIKCMC